jgi:phosphopantothenoylcysteine decarboxylase / phosphopantothenate---cysteine ligase
VLKGKKILIGVTGSIAAYKIPILVRLLLKEGAEVKVIMTQAAAEFVSRLTLSTLSKHPVLTDLSEDGAWSNHVMLGRWADVMLIAPLSCHTLSKMATGRADNLLLATYLSATSPVLVAPAMDEDMWLHPTTSDNLDTLRKNNVQVLPVEHGELASGLIGEGRMSEPESIVSYLEDFFCVKDQLRGKKALVTAGPTYEQIDPVRFIGNHSTGKMGYAIAEELARRGAEVILVSGPVALKSPAGVKMEKVKDAASMYDASVAHPDYDIAVLTAAVADYTPETVSEEKIKKTEGEMNIALKKTKDILSELGKKKGTNQVLVGFALETENEEVNARKKLKDKNADLIVLNSLRDEGAGFGTDTNQVRFYFRDGTEKQFGLRSKKQVAKDIVDSIIELLA